MKILKTSLLLVGLIYSVYSERLFARGGGLENNRSNHRFGFYFAFLDPFPSAFGASLGINIFNHLRIHGSYGQYNTSSIWKSPVGTSLDGIKLTTFGAGATFFFMNAKFSPAVSFNYAKVKFERIVGITYQDSAFGFSDNGEHFYGTLGFDIQSSKGFNFALGYSYSLKAGVGGCPYLRLGWFF